MKTLAVLLLLICMLLLIDISEQVEQASLTDDQKAALVLEQEQKEALKLEQAEQKEIRLQVVKDTPWSELKSVDAYLEKAIADGIMQILFALGMMCVLFTFLLRGYINAREGR